MLSPLEKVFFEKICATQVLPTGETVLKVKVPPVRIENSLPPLYRGTDFSALAGTFQTVWKVANGTFSSGLNVEKNKLRQSIKLNSSNHPEHYRTALLL